MRKDLVAAIVGVGLLSGCLSLPYQTTVDNYVAAYPKIDLGMTISDVDRILSPTQELLSASEKKQPDKYRKNGKNVDIIYYRSGWNSDGITTDDEFTPYVFNNGKLTAIGWQYLGGAKSQGQARDNNYSNTSVIVY